jgi:hypothetical protein
MAAMIGDGKGDRKPKPLPVRKYNNICKSNAIKTEIEVGEYFLIASRRIYFNDLL